MWLFWVTSRGPKIRVSTFKEGKVFLNIGDKFLLDANLGKGEGDKEKVGIDYKGLPADVSGARDPAAGRCSVSSKVLEVQGMKKCSPKSPSVVPSPTIKVSTNLAAVCRLKR